MKKKKIKQQEKYDRELERKGLKANRAKLKQKNAELPSPVCGDLM